MKKTWSSGLVVILLFLLVFSVVDAKEAIVFSYAEHGTFEIWIMNPDGSGRMKLTNSLNHHNWNPELSHDGTKIAFSTSSFSGSDGVYIMDADGSNQKLLATVSNGRWTSHPSFSPDNAKIVFDRGDSLCIINIDGTGLTTIQQGSGGRISWSPDGTKFVFPVGFMNIDGSGMTFLARGNNPSLSPDGTTISFDSDGPEGVQTTTTTEIYSIRIDGTDLKRLTNDPAFDEYPAWSPDGTKIIFSTTRQVEGGEWDLCIMNADGTNQHVLHSPESDLTPYWGFVNEKYVNIPTPEFPSIFLPVTMIIGILGTVFYIQRTKEH